MLDTNTLSYLAKRQSAETEKRLMSVSPLDRVVLSSITYGECRFGIDLAIRNGKRVPPFLHALLERFEALPWGAAEGEIYGRMRAQLRSMGKALAPLDTMIAAHAVAVEAVLISSDGAFVGVPGLQLESWATEPRSFEAAPFVPLA